jgi:hypothetical protein
VLEDEMKKLLIGMFIILMLSMIIACTPSQDYVDPQITTELPQIVEVIQTELSVPETKKQLDQLKKAHSLHHLKGMWSSPM